MSGVYVREKIIEYLGDAVPTEKLVDFTAEFEEVNDLLAFYGIGNSEPWLGVQFVGAEETPIDASATNEPVPVTGKSPSA